MCKSPKAPAPPPPPPEAPTQVDAKVTGAYDKEKRRRRAGHSSTIMTSPTQGQANVGKTILGG